MSNPLSGKQRRFLRAQGHGLQPVVLIGKDGASDAVLAAVAQALLDHELIKVKLGPGCEEDRHEIAATLAARSDSELVQVLGGTILLYRPHPENPRLELP